MALIKCPECGKEISDKSDNCINCGCPIENKEVDISMDQSLPAEEHKKKNKTIVILAISAIAILVIGFVIYNVKVIQPQKVEAKNKSIYEESIQLLEKGEYDQANNLLDTIPEYSNVVEVKEQLYYESRAFECIKSVKEYLKNPDSLQIYEVVFFDKEYRDDINITDEMKSGLNELIKTLGDEPVCLIRFGAQNGYGGNATSYGFFTYLADKKAYQYLGSCDTLDEDKVDEDEEKVCLIINMVRDNFKVIGNVNIDRIKTVLKSDNYTTIKIIE